MLYNYLTFPGKLCRNPRYILWVNDATKYGLYDDAVDSDHLDFLLMADRNLSPLKIDMAKMDGTIPPIFIQCGENGPIFRVEWDNKTQKWLKKEE